MSAESQTRLALRAICKARADLTRLESAARPLSVDRHALELVRGRLDAAVGALDGLVFRGWNWRQDAQRMARSARPPD
jgi:hypothetical protein